MQLGMVGLGRMGSNMVKRLLNNGHTAWCSTARRRRSRNWRKQKP